MLKDSNVMNEIVNNKKNNNQNNPFMNNLN